MAQLHSSSAYKKILLYPKLFPQICTVSVHIWYSFRNFLIFSLKNGSKNFLCGSNVGVCLFVARKKMFWIFLKKMIKIEALENVSERLR